jgi:hypothetical protein
MVRYGCVVSVILFLGLVSSPSFAQDNDSSALANPSARSAGLDVFFTGG